MQGSPVSGPESQGANAVPRVRSLRDASLIWAWTEGFARAALYVPNLRGVAVLQRHAVIWV